MAEVVSADGIELFREEIAGEGRIMRNKSLSFGSSKKNNVSGIFSSPSSLSEA
uniref:Uncharacterized protein n=1 Tax=Picea sitchensis TaxID=3332 RepID=A9NQM7_PICSI|nr:unknown [Picea sitchensis]